MKREEEREAEADVDVGPVGGYWLEMESRQTFIEFSHSTWHQNSAAYITTSFLAKIDAGRGMTLMPPPTQ